MQRVLVIGQSGSGKTTVAARLSDRLRGPHVELDALFHGPRWQPNPRFVEDVDLITAAPAWVVDGNYRPVRDLLWSRADTVVWLDLPRRTTTGRAAVRTMRRWLLRVELWNGNREQLRDLLRASHPIRWSWSTHSTHRAEYERRLCDPRWQHLTVVRLRSPDEVRCWLATVDASPS